MLDDQNVLAQRDRQGALEVAANLYKQAQYEVPLQDTDHDGREIANIVIAGMGGSALAADMIKVLVKDHFSQPLEVVKGYTLPGYVGVNTLVIASSHSGNTEETVSCLNEAIERGAQIGVTATGGKLREIAEANHIMYANMPHDTQPRMAVFYNLRSMLAIMQAVGLNTQGLLDEVSASAEWLKSESDKWIKEVGTEQNYAKQLALLAVGKTPVIYGGNLMAPVAYKWKISWNENAKNVAFWNFYPEFNHNEFLGWTSHPVEKPFVIFDLRSNLENPRILKRFELSDKLLSGMRPKANAVELKGDSLIQQMLWGCTLADFVSIYVAILNNVDPTQVDLIEKFKKELAS
jgi:glucose/mannose-6-phosphate isomerase